ncbi:acetyl-CoA C-acyltransferase [Photobacterium carnosum]|uniref:acetyl-CoA C-acyltransferase n=1 Tax=Photobacterium carnosum TaxID=2023717 RepID=UPI001E5F4642|nr:acetyl-CoA C-acyltransferase [Photobacterium carnosum]MCD9496578.1 acetyl-CoA C-acyltransferase [Photobacterium carnosum]
MEKVFILGAKRTAIGSFNGSLKEFSASDLSAFTIKESIKQSKVSIKDVNEVILGNVINAGQGMGPGRQASIKAGLSYSIPAYTINMICGSGMKSVTDAVSHIKSGESELIIASGSESMSNIPLIIPSKVRTGSKIGGFPVQDLLLTDGLTDGIDNYHMGVTTENINSLMNITREDQDDFALQSQIKAQNAIKNKLFKEEIIPIKLNNGFMFNVDEYPKNTSIEKLSKLNPAFKENGSVTAGNSSGLNDGGSSIVLSSERYMKKNNLVPLCEVIAYKQVGVDPKIMGLGPIDAILGALKNAGLSINDIDRFEINEAFAGQSLGVINGLTDNTSIDKSELIKKINTNGGAIALGHPLGSSGNRIIVSLIYELKRNHLKYGLAALCIGGGMGISIIIKNIELDK